MNGLSWTLVSSIAERTRRTVVSGISERTRRIVTVWAAAAVLTTFFVEVPPAFGLPKGILQSGPPPVIDLSNVNSTYSPALQAFENNAVSEVLATHNLPSTDANAVLGWGRDDVRAQEWIDLSKIITEPDASRSANDETVLQWFRSVYVQQQIAEAQAAINEYLKWSGGQSLTDQPVNFGSNNSGYCNYSPPGGDSGPFAGSYTGNQDQDCFTPCTSVFGCPAPYPTIDQFLAWGAYDEINQEISNSDFANASLGTIGSIAIGASMVSAGVTTALSAAFGGAGLSSEFVSALFPFLARVAWQSASTIADVGISAGADAAETAAISGAATAGAVAFVVGIVVFFIVSTVIAIMQLVQDAAIPGQLQDALDKAEQNTTPDLASLLSDSSTASGLYAMFMSTTMPDVDYACTNASPDPCADEPTPPGSSGTDDVFLVSTTSAGVTTTTPTSSIYTVDQRSADFISTRLSGNGWFVSTRYNGADPTNLNAPTSTAGATVEGLQFFYTDWQGKHWVAERIDDASSNPEFAVAPMDSSGGDPCASGTATTNGACITKTLDVQTPNGTNETVTVAPASAVAPSFKANVPPIVTTGHTSSYSASGTDPNNLPLSYSWTFYCPGSAPGLGIPCFGGEFGSFSSTTTGSTVSASLPTPGTYHVYVTAADTAGYSTTSIYAVNSVAESTTTVAPTVPSASVFGQPVTFTATVTANPSCHCWFSGIPLSPDGFVQFYVDGVAHGAPVRVSQSAGTDGSGNYYAAAVSGSISDMGAGSRHVTGVYLPLGASYGFGGLVPDLQPGFFGSQGDTTFVVLKDATTTSVSTSTSSSVYGQSVTFTATVAPKAPGGGATTGVVQFSVDGVALGTPVALNAQGKATSPADASLSVGDHSITATYSGDINFTGSTSSALSQSVGRAGTTTALGTSTNPSMSGTAVTLTATVAISSPGAGNPTGTVTFKDGGVTLGTGSVTTTAGVTTATFTTSALAVGAHSITAVYGGDANVLGSTSAALTQNVDTSLSGYPKLGSGAYNLGNTNLAGAYLVGLSLVGADLSNSNFKGANFAGANLTGANLTSANLKGAVGLSSATLTNVHWDGTQCPDGTSSSKDGGNCIGHL